MTQKADLRSAMVAKAKQLGGLGFTGGFTTRHDFARASEAALERSRFVVLAAVTAAELAHRIT
jgi:hypothetical protein